jgi:hypothetical protein
MVRSAINLEEEQVGSFIVPWVSLQNVGGRWNILFLLSGRNQE